MFFILSKLLNFLISPFTWLFLLLVWALFTKNEQRRKKLLKGVLFLVLFFSNAFILDEFMRLWEVPATADANLKGDFDVAIVMGGISAYDEQLDRLQVNRSADRLLQAVRLFRMGRVKTILFTGGSGSILHQHIKEGELVRKMLLDMQIPDSCILIENESKNTAENAAESKKILDREFPGGRFLLVTSGFHMNRAAGCFSKAGVKFTPYVTDRYAGPRKWEFDHLFIPNVHTLQAWNTLMHEWVGMLAYKVMGFI